MSTTGWHVGVVYDKTAGVWRVYELILSTRIEAIPSLRKCKFPIAFGVLYVPAPVGCVAKLDQSIGYSCSPRRLVGV